MIVLLTGEKNAGKTTAVERTVRILRERGVSVAGFFEEDVPSGLALVDVATGERIPFARSTGSNRDEVRVGRYSIRPEAIARGIDLARRPAEVLVVDEIGTLEQRGEGFQPVVQAFDTGRHPNALLSIRMGVLDFVRDSLPSGTRTTTITVTPENRSGLPERIATILHGVD